MRRPGTGRLTNRDAPIARPVRPTMFRDHRTMSRGRRTRRSHRDQGRSDPRDHMVGKVAGTPDL
jgi:hypothetical protein